MGKKIQCIGRYVMEGQTLGKGTFARVELASHSITACKVAIKIIDTRKLKEEYMRNNLHREARILGQLRHPNIIRLYETLKAATLYCVCMEYAAGGELFSFIKIHPESRLPEDRARPFVRQILSAVHYLHERGVAHRDLKMENIMLDEKKKNIKIVDFGLSNTFSKDNLMKTHCGSPEYAAPELFNPSEKYGPEIDIWSLGIIFYAMLVGKLPFTTPSSDQFRRRELQQQIEKGLVNSHFKEMVHLSPECKELINKLIEPSPSLRLPLMDVEIHPWVTLEAKFPFHPFQSFIKDKPMRNQTLDELSELLSMERSELEQTVHDNRCDEISAMFNMIMDKKRVAKGIFDMDHTAKPDIKPQRKERTGRTKRTRSSLPKPKNTSSPNNKTDTNADNLIDGVEPSQQSTSFDFLALCSAPTWLGPGRRRSGRRKSRWPDRSTPSSERARSQSPDPSRLTESSPVHSPLAGKAQLPTESAKSRASQRRSRSCGPHDKRTSLSLQSESIDVPDEDQADLTPRQSPVTRPARLTIQECYKPSVKQLQIEPHSPNGPLTTVEVHFADSSNPCSTTNFHESTEGSSSNIPLLQEENEQPSDSLVEQSAQKIFLADKPPVKVLNNVIVKPKQKLLTNNFLLPVDSRLSGAIPKQKVTSSLSSSSQPKLLGPINNSGSSESFLESMQTNNYANLSDDEKLEKCKQNNSNLPRTDSEKRIEQGITDLKLTDPEDIEEKVDSTSHLLAESVTIPSSSGLGLGISSGPKRTSRTRLTVPGSFLDSKNSPPDHTPDDTVFSELQEHDEDDDNESIILKVLKENSPRRLPHSGLLRHSSGSVKSQKRTNSLSSLKTPITPNKQFLRSPLARIESFHSDDFDMLRSDVDARSERERSDAENNSTEKAENSPSPSQSSEASVNCMKAPIVPCLTGVYQKQKIKTRSKCKCQTVLKETSLTTERLQERAGKNERLLDIKEGNDVIGDRILEETVDRIAIGGSSKIHPIVKDDQEGDTLHTLHMGKSKIPRPTNKTGYQMLTSLCSDVTNKPPKSKHMQKAMKNSINFEPTHEQKKAAVKSSTWKRGFAHFLKKKRTKRYPSNNNNDSANSCHLTATTNNSHTTSPVTKSAPICLEAENLREPESLSTVSPASAILANTDVVEFQRSPAICHSPGPLTKVFDFPGVHDSPKRMSCLISWKRCRECTFTDQSSDEDSEHNFQLEDKVTVTANKPPLAINNIQEVRLASTCSFANT